ncbi:Hypothetical_protein [Hexamita inflata]|uniref:Hypothetical_protein n=1 Tax=Hexamita inflata TaxID=28002 RepID=A0AA86PDP7_9EUKA|nr:Hypothetical protein HINF_LOCUS23213 [Hexamita inflata]
MGNCICYAKNNDGQEILPLPSVNPNSILNNKFKTSMYDSFYLSFNAQLELQLQNTNEQTLDHCNNSFKSPSLDSFMEDISEAHVIFEITSSDEDLHELPQMSISQ